MLLHDIVNRYANDKIAQKYKITVIKVRTVLSFAPNDVCIFSIQIWILLNNGSHRGNATVVAIGSRMIVIQGCGTNRFVQFSEG